MPFSFPFSFFLAGEKAGGYLEMGMTPAEAVRDGATHLVVGRPVLAAPDPVAAAQAIVAEIGG